ncbi:homoserine O-succinyltransferase [Angomonas deanei]|nr:homoserine O-succinyltransferase [Angomonas deanei]CAD2217530.1 Homoserine O-succinyltransferase, putative [Angomonas deanei]|eukprot:EPY19634.1 homoserine O-succinyltransferase [Angomonas deanei]
MPLKITTETDLIRLLSNTPLQIDITLLKLVSHTPKNTPVEHLNQFYEGFDTVQHRKYDGMIITGAPIEEFPFEEVKYWEEMTKIMDWSRTNVTSTMFICWAAQAALYHFYGVPKNPLPKKMFGVFEIDNLDPLNPIMRGFDDVFFAPHSRHTDVKREDIVKHSDLEIIAESADAGVHMVLGRKGKEVFITGHAEYSRFTLDAEYKRDVNKGLEIEIPRNYYPNDDPSKDPQVRWRGHGNLMYANWLNYFVYQATPFSLNH